MPKTTIEEHLEALADPSIKGHAIEVLESAIEALEAETQQSCCFALVEGRLDFYENHGHVYGAAEYVSEARNLDRFLYAVFHADALAYHGLRQSDGGHLCAYWFGTPLDPECLSARIIGLQLLIELIEDHANQETREYQKD